MLGLLRFALALCVVIAHLPEMVFFSHWGVFAVFGFYLVSGYLMTIILQETYQFQFHAFAINRFLRLFPIYYVVALASYGLILMMPEASASFHPMWKIRYQPFDFLANALIVPFGLTAPHFCLIPTIWSVAAELIDYFLLWLVVARNHRWALTTVILSIVYHCIDLSFHQDWGRRYFPFYAALLPFSLGACLYFFRDYLIRFSNATIQVVALIALLIWVGNLIYCGGTGGLNSPDFNTAFYVNLGALCVLVYCLTHAAMNKLWLGIGKYLGDLAYPIFLVHWIVGFGVATWVLDGQKRGLILLAVSTFPILIVAGMLSWLANWWLEPIRDRIRRRISLPTSY